MLIDQQVLTEADMFTFELACESYNQFREMHDAIYRPIDQDTGKKYKRTLAEYMVGRNSQTAPEYAAMRNAYQTHKTYMAEFGLSPVARNRIDLPEPKKDDIDPMEALLNEG